MVNHTNHDREFLVDVKANKFITVIERLKEGIIFFLLF